MARQLCGQEMKCNQGTESTVETDAAVTWPHNVSLA